MNSEANIEKTENIFPFDYLLDFIKFLKSSDRFNIITYDDLDWSHELGRDEIYRAEFRSWNERVKASDELSNKISVLIQFDVDSSSRTTTRYVSDMLKIGAPANVMLFNKRINRQLLSDTGIVEEVGYPIDDELYLNAQNRGFVVGYHTNAVERAQHDLNRAVEIFRQDLNDLRSRFPSLRYFSPHGGVRSASGLNNNDLPYDEVVNEELGTFWVHNRNAPSFNHRFSDGGIVGRAQDPDRVNLRAAVKDWRVGNRCRVLLHPQYYGGDAPDTRERLRILMSQENHREIWDAYSGRSNWQSDASSGLGASPEDSVSDYWSSLKFDEEVGGFV